MNRKFYLKKIIKEFEKWWINDSHFLNMDFYKTNITKNNLSSLSDKFFVNFFSEFINEGGRVQSGGYRTKNKFYDTLEKNLNNFRKYILLPFQDEFSLQDWFAQRKEFPGFGVGIATIFLNRIDCNKFPVMNNKTIKALNKLGYKITSSKNFENYKLVKKYQNNLITEFPELQNYYKSDAFNHFVVAVYQGQELISNYLQIENLDNELEQHEIEYNIEAEDIDKEKLYQKIIEFKNNKSEKITVNGKTYKRHNYLMAFIKKYRDYKCQFCATTILKANGSYYIEACHIKPKAEGGKDALDNILVLCPNCHKLFDHGERSNEKKSKESYNITINGKDYETTLK